MMKEKREMIMMMKENDVKMSTLYSIARFDCATTHIVLFPFAMIVIIITFFRLSLGTVEWPPPQSQRGAISPHYDNLHSPLYVTLEVKVWLSSIALSMCKGFVHS